MAYIVHGGRRYRYIDIRGQRFGRLVALEPTEVRDHKGGVVWLCRCDCGSLVERPYDSLAHSGVRSCGCLQREHDARMPDLREHVDGTFIDALRSRKIRSDNTTGAKGVYKIGARYAAKIVFQGRQYQLGTYSSFEDAKAARRSAEAEVFDKAVSHYEAWTRLAEVDPDWARDNPVRFNVTKTGPGTVRLECKPDLEPIRKGKL